MAKTTYFWLQVDVTFSKKDGKENQWTIASDEYEVTDKHVHNAWNKATGPEKDKIWGEALSSLKANVGDKFAELKKEGYVHYEKWTLEQIKQGGRTAH